MDVEVHETRCDDLAFHIADDGTIWRREASPDRRDLSVLNEHIGGIIQVAARIDDATALQ